MNRFFVTAIGTEIGKTYVSARLIEAWRASGRAVHARKPLMSGFDADHLAESDAGQLLQALGESVTVETVDQICLHRFEAPLAPNHAMRLAGVEQDDQRLRRFIAQAHQTAGDDVLLVEGAGGLMSPMTDTLLHIDMMAELAWPVILVAANYLGAVSQTLTALECIERRGLSIAALIISQPSPDAGDPTHLAHEIGLFWHGPAFKVGFGARVGEVAGALLSSASSRA